MKVTRNTPNQLIITDTPWLIGIMMIIFVLTLVSVGLFLISEGVWAGPLFVVVGGGLGSGAFAVFVRRVQLIFDRRSGTITHRTRSIFGYSEVQHELANLSHANLDTSTGPGGVIIYRPILVFDAGMSAGQIPIVNVHTSTSSPYNLVYAINTWLGVNPS